METNLANHKSQNVTNVEFVILCKLLAVDHNHKLFIVCDCDSVQAVSKPVFWP